MMSLRYVHSSEIDDRDSFVLSIPENKFISKHVTESVPYSASLPGEFIDVDLPDETKNKKQKNLISVVVNNKDHLLVDKSDVASGYYCIQVASFSKKENAEDLNKKLLAGFYRTEIVPRKTSHGAVRYDVRFGKYKTRNQAEQALLKYKSTYNTGAYIIAPE